MVFELIIENIDNLILTEVGWIDISRVISKQKRCCHYRPHTHLNLVLRVRKAELETRVYVIAGLEMYDQQGGLAQMVERSLSM